MSKSLKASNAFPRAAMRTSYSLRRLISMIIYRIISLYFDPVVRSVNTSNTLSVDSGTIKGRLKKTMLLWLITAKEAIEGFKDGESAYQQLLFSDPGDVFLAYSAPAGRNATMLDANQARLLGDTFGVPSVGLYVFSPQETKGQKMEVLERKAVDDKLVISVMWLTGPHCGTVYSLNSGGFFDLALFSSRLTEVEEGSVIKDRSVPFRVYMPSTLSHIASALINLVFLQMLLLLLQGYTLPIISNLRHVFHF